MVVIVTFGLLLVYLCFHLFVCVFACSCVSSVWASWFLDSFFDRSVVIILVFSLAGLQSLCWFQPAGKTSCLIFFWTISFCPGCSELPLYLVEVVLASWAMHPWLSISVPWDDLGFGGCQLWGSYSLILPSGLLVWLILLNRNFHGLSATLEAWVVHVSGSVISVIACTCSAHIW